MPLAKLAYSGSQHYLLSSFTSYLIMMFLAVFLFAFVQAVAAGEFRNEFVVSSVVR